MTIERKMYFFFELQKPPSVFSSSFRLRGCYIWDFRIWLTRPRDSLCWSSLEACLSLLAATGASSRFCSWLASSPSGATWSLMGSRVESQKSLNFWAPKQKFWVRKLFSVSSCCQIYPCWVLLASPSSIFVVKRFSLIDSFRRKSSDSVWEEK